MKLFANLFICFCLIVTASGQSRSNSYGFVIDLNKTKGDQLFVDLSVPRIHSDTIIYNMPRTVPGTYSTDNYGHFVSNFTATDAQGNQLKTVRVNVNSWQISNAKALRHINYMVNDTFDDTTRAEKVFEPTGSNFEVDTNYIINTFTVMGYFTAMELNPYRLEIIHPDFFYGSTAMKDENTSATVDLFTAKNYHEIADNPIMYCKPDTATIRVGGATLLVSVFSPNHVITSRFLATRLDSLAKAQVKYLKGKLPVDRYAYLIYLSIKPSISGGYGALEHSNSSLYSLPQTSPEAFIQQFKDVAAHEFFHILTPLNVHAEQIQYFNFTEPKMSQHLWLYEGSTEYHAHKAQVQSGLISVHRFLQVMSDKITTSLQRYNDSLPMVFWSEHILEPPYSRQFGNVYHKGALVNLCLDIKLRTLSNGKYGIVNLIMDLSKTYGKGKPFKDSELFTVISRLTYPEIGEFLQTYVAGSGRLPLDDILKDVGIKRLAERSDRAFSLGGIRIRENNGQFFIASTQNLNEFGKKMGYAAGDSVLSINGTLITSKNLNEILTALNIQAKEGDILKVVVVRKNAEKNEIVTLVQPIFFVDIKHFNELLFDDNASKQQLMLRNNWLSK